MPASFRILTQNVKHILLNTDFARARRMADAILNASPGYDVVCLQECFIEGIKSEFAERLRGRFPYQVRSVHDGDVFQEDSGLYFASRLPFKRTRSWGFEEFDDHDGADGLADKGIFGAVLSLDEDFDLCVFNTHLQADYKTIGQFAGIRQRQLDQIRRFVARSLSRVERPDRTAAVIVGDFNVVAERERNGELLSAHEYVDMLRRLRFARDAYRAGPYPDDPGYTWDGVTNLNMLSTYERLRLDYVLGFERIPNVGNAPTPWLAQLAITAAKVQMFDTRFDTRLSDHYGVEVAFDVTPAPSAQDALTAVLAAPDEAAANHALDLLMETVRAEASATTAVPLARAPSEPEQPSALLEGALRTAGVAADAAATDHRWQNWAGNIVLQPNRLVRPATLQSLVKLVKEASGSGRRIRPVAVGHSFSDILDGDDLVIDVTGLNDGSKTGLLDREDDLWKSPAQAVKYQRMVAGATIRLLNTSLDAAGLAFRNLGGYDAQSIIGALSTSTHGSGAQLGALPDEAVSLDVVTADGTIYRIEPSDGVTDPNTYQARYPERVLKQDDKWFQSVVVSMGCMGIIYAVTMRVSTSYLIEEVRHVMPWTEARAELATDARRRLHRHLEVLINPYTKRCAVMRRNPARSDARPSAPTLKRSFNGLLASSQLFRDLVLHIMKRDPSRVPWLLDEAIDSLEDTVPYIRKSYDIFNLGAPNNFAALSAEFAFPVEKAVSVAERFIELIIENQAKCWYQTSPISLRLVKASPAYLSMMYGQDTVMIETPILQGRAEVEDVLRSYEALCHDLGGRPHWGQFNERAGKAWVQERYARFDDWLDVYRQLNAKGTFNNAFTDRLGISVTP